GLRALCPDDRCWAVGAMLESAHARGLAAKEEGMASYAEQVGERLRNIRLQKGLSLPEGEERSGKEFKASVLGAYERGERSISVPRLQRLAIFYGVRVDHLLPRLGPEATQPAAARNADEAGFLHLEGLEGRR